MPQKDRSKPSGVSVFKKRKQPLSGVDKGFLFFWKIFSKKLYLDDTFFEKNGNNAFEKQNLKSKGGEPQWRKSKKAPKRKALSLITTRPTCTKMYRK